MLKANMNNRKLFPLKVGQRVKNHLNARGILIEVRNNPWGCDHIVVITNQHPLYDVGEIQEFRREDLKPIISL